MVRTPGFHPGNRVSTTRHSPFVSSRSASPFATEPERSSVLSSTFHPLHRFPGTSPGNTNVSVRTRRLALYSAPLPIARRPKFHSTPVARPRFVAPRPNPPLPRVQRLRRPVSPCLSATSTGHRRASSPVFRSRVARTGWRVHARRAPRAHRRRRGRRRRRGQRCHREGTHRGAVSAKRRGMA